MAALISCAAAEGSPVKVGPSKVAMAVRMGARGEFERGTHYQMTPSCRAVTLICQDPRMEFTLQREGRANWRVIKASKRVHGGYDLTNPIITDAQAANMIKHLFFKGH